MKTSAVKITKKEFNAALVENTTAQIYGRSSTYNRFNDIVAAVNNAETMKNVKDNAEWRTVTKTRANGVTFSNGSTLDYAPNNHENNVNYYRVGNVVIMVAARRNDASDYERNPYIYLIVAYLIDTPETTTMNTETKAMNEVTVTISPDGSDLYAATVNGVTVGSVNTWFNNTFAASYNFGINTRKRLGMPELNNANDAAHGFMTEHNAVLWLGDMIARYFAGYGITANIVNA